MTRPLHSRVLSLALSLWLSLFLSESEWIVRCPAHAGGAHAASVSEHVAGAASHGLASTGGAAHDHAATSSVPTGHDTSHNCSCPGPGCCPPAVAVVPGSGLPIDHVVAVHEARAVSTLDRLEDETEYLLPPATAPPPVALAPSA